MRCAPVSSSSSSSSRRAARRRQSSPQLVTDRSFFDGKTAEGCPLHAVVTGTFNDSFEGSESNQARCMNRASEYHAYCGSSQPVRTRFYNGRTVVKEETAR